MRSFESYLLIGCVVAVLWPAVFGVRSRRGIVAASMVALVVLQLVMEGYRWQLIVLYGVAGGLAVGDIVAIERDLPWFRRVGRGVFGLLGLGLVMAPAVLLPVPTMPLPSGPLPIGTVTVTVTDGERDELYGSRPGTARRFPVQVWYPAAAVDGLDPQPLSPDIGVLAPALARHLGLPAFFFGHTSSTDSHSFGSAPVLEGAFPLAVFSHDWAGSRAMAIDQIENLASQGYIVVAPDHPYSAVVTVIDDDQVHLDPAALAPPGATEAQRLEAEAALIGVHAADVTTILDQLALGGEGAFGELSSSIDIDDVGLWGHGLGGGAALQVCLTDERCDVIVGFDPWVDRLPNPILAITATKPMLFLGSDEWRETPNQAVLRGVVARSETLGYEVNVLGADTSDFGVAPWFSPVADRLGMKGPIDGPRMTTITRRFLTAFFDRIILQTGPAALDTATFAETEVTVTDNR